jgi:photosystem II stability/assembly factor-like uncharacterized protein
MDLESSDPQESDITDNTDLVFAMAAIPGCQPGISGRVFAARNSGLYVSEDGGRSWGYALEQIGLTEPMPITCLAVTPISTEVGHVFAGAPGGIFRSTDSGRNWHVILLPTPPPTVSALATSPNYAEDQTLFAGTVEDGIFISRDSGRSFSTWNFGLLDLNVMSLAISPDFARDETIYAGTETGIFRSTNGGRAWRDIDVPFGYDAVLSLAITNGFSADDSTRLVAGTENHGLWSSSDGGETWLAWPVDETNEPVNAILPGPLGLTVVTNAGLFHSSGSGGKWKSLLPAEDQDRQPIAVLPASGQTTLVSFADGEIALTNLRFE